MRNGAYTLALLAAVLGLVLLAGAAPGEGFSTSLGTAMVAVAVLLAGVGKVIDLLGHVRDGATEGDD